ncbi:nitronate monooxygenase family protein [Paenibacillus glycanilyticus]|uniref:NAD(P)H-dependent flavin oxidoreductase n=1 Tax=Paenibacillus glycanilyticus TaxID=126569 RepID=UPI0020403765|nr:nitronate monooxygenase family protein [Paenibacillus glycanilyticus]MCM3628336.1 nitronate monooxygenase family protein [Paenibacillus glycanilyticus]
MQITLQTKLCEQFGIQYPLFLAGMAGGPSTPELTASVSEAGGLGTLGAAYMEPEDIRAAVRRIRELTAAPFGVNLFVYQAGDDHTRMQEVQSELNKMRQQLGIPASAGNDVRSANWFEKQFEVLIEEKVPVISTAFGILPAAYMQTVKAAGLKVIAMVTTVREAMLAEESGYDAIVAQGSEAGGHRGTFTIDDHPMGANIGTMALIPQIADRVSIPVIAAGGIMDGRGLAAALILGAQGAQLGTRFLTAVEAGTNQSYRKALLASDEESTVLTKAFSGRPARGIKNAFIQQWEESGIAPLAFPTQNTVTRDIRNAASKQQNSEYLSLWAGQGTRMLTEDQTAKQIVEDIMHQAQAILQ